MPGPLVLVTGAEALLAERAVARVRELAREQHADLEVVTVEGPLYEAGQLATWVSPSLFEEPRLVEVVGVEAASDALVADLLAHLGRLGAEDGQAPDDLVLVLRHAGGARARAVLEAARGVRGGQVVDCAPLKSPRDQRAFLQGEFARSGRPATPAAIDQLHAALGQDLRALAAAVTQLVSDVPAGGRAGAAGRRAPVDVADVDRYYGGRAEVSGFAVADAAVAGHREEALRLTRQALEAGVDPIPMIAALAMKLRAMVKVAAAGRGRDADVARAAGMAPWQVERARADLRGWTPEGIATSLIALAEADAAAKGLSRDPVYAIERAVLVVTGARS